jgi:hypothetical protein
VVPENDNDNDNSDRLLLEPTDGPHSVAQVHCYLPLLQRIVNCNYVNDTSSTFLVEMPQSELVDWDGVRGANLAQSATDNTLRYHALFCAVLDDVLQGLPPTAPSETTNTTTHGSLLRGTVDMLHKQRLEQAPPR